MRIFFPFFLYFSGLLSGIMLLKKQMPAAAPGSDRPYSRRGLRACRTIYLPIHYPSLPAMTGQETESLSVRYHLSNGGEHMTKKNTSGQGGAAFLGIGGRILIILLAVAVIVIGVVVWYKVDPNSMPIWLQQMIISLENRGPSAGEIPPVPPVPDI